MSPVLPSNVAWSQPGSTEGYTTKKKMRRFKLWRILLYYKNSIVLLLILGGLNKLGHNNGYVTRNKYESSGTNDRTITGSEQLIFVDLALCLECFVNLN